jgi:hypothetical protein
MTASQHRQDGRGFENRILGKIGLHTPKRNKILKDLRKSF